MWPAPGGLGPLGVQGQIPYMPGAEFSRPGGRRRIRSVFILPNGDVNVTAELSRLDLSDLTGGNLSMGPFVLVNPVRHKLAMVYRQFGGRSEDSALATVSRVEIFPFHHVWSLATHQRAGDLDEAWMKDAQLAVEFYRDWGDERTSLIDWGEVTLPSEPAGE